MLITEKQILKMYEMLLLMSQEFVSLTPEGRDKITRLVQEIRSQQSEKLIDTKDKE